LVPRAACVHRGTVEHGSTVRTAGRKRQPAKMADPPRSGHLPRATAVAAGGPSLEAPPPAGRPICSPCWSGSPGRCERLTSTWLTAFWHELARRPAGELALGGLSSLPALGRVLTVSWLSPSIGVWVDGRGSDPDRVSVPTSRISSTKRGVDRTGAQATKTATALTSSPTNCGGHDLAESVGDHDGSARVRAVGGRGLAAFRRNHLPARNRFAMPNAPPRRRAPWPFIPPVG